MRTLATILLLAFAIPVLAAEEDIPASGIGTLFEELEQAPVTNDIVPPADTGYASDIALQQIQVNNEFWYIVMLCMLSIISLFIVLTFLKNQEHTARDIVNATGLTLIIFATIILVLVVNTSEQLTAAIGILGAIAGYLFRSAQEKS